MKLFSANLEDLRELYVSSLKKALDMEQHITKALPTMIEKATDPSLKQAFETHLQETEGHVTTVEGILRALTGEVSTETCKVISALVTEAEDTVKDTVDPTVRDAGLIASAQQVEHHEIAVYGTLRSWAETLGEGGQVLELESILSEEKNADQLLSSISDSVNPDAEAPVTRAAA